MKPEIKHDKNGNPNIHECCSCGYWWYHGSNGSHSCHKHISGRIESLKESLGELHYDNNRVKGLKDHEICELVNVIRDRVRNMFGVEHACLREGISSVVLKYLEEKKLRVDIKPELRG